MATQKPTIQIIAESAIAVLMSILVFQAKTLNDKATGMEKDIQYQAAAILEVKNLLNSRQADTDRKIEKLSERMRALELK